MVLSSLERGVLEKQIDHTIKGMKLIVDTARGEAFKPWLRDKDGVDMAIGISFGEILALYISGYLIRNNQPPSDEEKTEIRQIINKRLGEIREAVYNCG